MNTIISKPINSIRSSLTRQILVFKTSIRQKKDERKVRPWLDDLEGISSWNVDLKDKDKILRIVGRGVDPEEVIYRVKRTGFICEELKK